jgi:hypothetical protein
MPVAAALKAPVSQRTQELVVRHIPNLVQRTPRPFLLFPTPEPRTGASWLASSCVAAGLADAVAADLADGADANLRAPDGSMMLDVDAAGGFVTVVDFVIGAGDARDALDRVGATPLEAAVSGREKGRDVTCAPALLNAGEALVAPGYSGRV